MTRIESKEVSLNKSAAAVHTLLSKFENFEKFMPDSVTKFEADDTSFKFGLRGLPEVRLVLDETRDHDLIKLKSASGKIDFALSALITTVSDDSSKLKFQFEGKFNPMMRMMVERPLTAFIEDLVNKVAAS